MNREGRDALDAVFEEGAGAADALLLVLVSLLTASGVAMPTHSSPRVLDAASGLPSNDGARQCGSRMLLDGRGWPPVMNGRRYGGTAFVCGGADPNDPRLVAGGR